ncbi:universal stress protein UspA [Burkholderia singularis]|uniref:Universal stress protein n=1 Tax=Burkholderia singularis TaxID=1503053 RepID=A0A103DYH1_9BURK|nr:universal stress protein [Burkholderia singularis]KVE24880.1 universal stress protein UspA [Burkholderia singularis]
MYQNIMVAIDGSAPSMHALAEALKLAKLSGAHVRAVYVIDTSVLFTYAGLGDPRELLEDARIGGAEVLTNAQSALAQAGVAGDTESIETDSIGDDIASRLERYVEQHHFDLAVIGTHGRRGVRRLLLGSVAERFVRTSSCPVLLVRADEPPRSARAAA